MFILLLIKFRKSPYHWSDVNMKHAWWCITRWHLMREEHGNYVILIYICFVKRDRDTEWIQNVFLLLCDLLSERLRTSLNLERFANSRSLGENYLYRGTKSEIEYIGYLLSWRSKHFQYVTENCAEKHVCTDNFCYTTTQKKTPVKITYQGSKIR